MEFFGGGEGLAFGGGKVTVKAGEIPVAIGCGKGIGWGVAHHVN